MENKHHNPPEKMEKVIKKWNEGKGKLQIAYELDIPPIFVTKYLKMGDIPEAEIESREMKQIDKEIKYERRLKDMV